ncbi:hypothetical protein KY362_03345 [Candidatus Woesearchaeota archaeon]|nr:hypothetical protein [Candidatus Woesearchaeota archaeon]
MGSRKGQIAGQIFIYIIAVVVVGLIIVYGYSAIKGFTQRGEEVEYIGLKTNIENAVKGITSDFGSIKRPDITIPGKYEYVCFVNKDLAKSPEGKAKIETDSICTGLGVDTAMHSPVACAAWDIGRDNVFLLPDGSDSFDVGEITIKRPGVTGSADSLCFEVVGNKINMQLKGLGDRVEVSSYEE